MMHYFRFSRLLYVGFLFVLVACQPIQPVTAAGQTTTATLAPPTATTLTDDMKVVATIKTGTSGMGMAAGADALWVTARNDQAIKRVDPQTNEVVAAIKVGAETNGLAFGAGALWAAGESDRAVYRIDPRY